MSLDLPCKHEPPRFVPGEKFQTGRDCNVCYLAYHDRAYSLRFGGDGNITDPMPGTTVKKIPWHGAGVVTDVLRLGDHAEKAFATVGITKERVEKWIGGKCGCEERKQKLNRIGAWVASVLTGGRNEDEARSELDQMIAGKPTS